MASTRYAVGNHKGGSGKTSVVVGLAAALAEAGRRVLAVDMDPQANASRRLAAGYDPDHPTPTTAEVVHNGSEGIAADAIKPCGWPDPYASRISVIPSRFDLDNRLSEAGQIGAVLRLSIALEGVDAADYDVTLIDCQPSMAHLTQLALAAAHYGIAVTDPEYDGVDGAIRFRDFIEDHRTRRGLGNPDLGFAGLIVNRYDQRISAHRWQIDGLPATFGHAAIWLPHIPERAAVKDATDAHLPLRLVRTTQARNQAAIYADLAPRLLAKETTA